MSSASPPPSLRVASPDYLVRLVDRAAQRAPLLERRRPALFERPSSQVPQAEELIEHVAAETRSAAPIVAAGAEPQREVLPRTVAAPLHESAAYIPRIATDVPTPAVQVGQVPPRQPKAWIAPVQASLPAQESQPAVLVPALARQGFGPTAVAEPVVHSTTAVEHFHHHTQRVVEVHHEVAQRLVSPEPRRERLPLADAPLAQAERAPPSSPQRSAAPAPAADWRPLSPPESMAQPVRIAAVRAVAAPAPAAPTPVQISIGRVEVRATTPAAPGKPRGVRREPQLSLDQYLRERGGGSR